MQTGELITGIGSYVWLPNRGQTVLLCMPNGTSCMLGSPFWASPLFLADPCELLLGFPLPVRVVKGLSINGASAYEEPPGKLASVKWVDK
jgi:hypothetical protein